MKESTLIEMQNKTEAMGRVLQKMIHDIEFLNTMVMGDHEVIKRLSEYPEIINQLKEEHGRKEENTDGVTTGDSGLTLTDE